jgi:hypothetical protein
MSQHVSNIFDININIIYYLSVDRGAAAENQIIEIYNCVKKIFVI